MYTPQVAQCRPNHKFASSEISIYPSLYFLFLKFWFFSHRSYQENMLKVSLGGLMDIESIDEYYHKA